MDPEPSYGEISSSGCSSIKRLLEIELISDFDEQELQLDFGITEGYHTAGRASQDCRARSSASVTGILGQLFEQPKLEVTWKIQHINGTAFVRSQTRLSFQPSCTSTIYFPTNRQPGAMHVFGLRGGYEVSPKLVKLGTKECTADFYNTELENPEKEDAKWTFKAKHNDIGRLGSSFKETFGGQLVRLIFEVKKVSRSKVLCSDVSMILRSTYGHPTECFLAFGLSDRENHLVQCARREFAAVDPDLFVIKCGDKEFKAPKSRLARRSRIFATCFQHPETEEVTSSCYVIRDSTPEAVECLVMYCDHLLVPDIDKHGLDLAKLAHKYEVQKLLDICELSMMDQVSGFVDRNERERSEKFSQFMDICAVASLLELPLLLSQLYFVFAALEENMVQEVEISLWLKFLKDTPDFAVQRIQAIANMKGLKC